MRCASRFGGRTDRAQVALCPAANGVDLPIRAIVADALALSSSALILVHDHLVFAAPDCFSFRAAGLL